MLCVDSGDLSRWDVQELYPLVAGDRRRHREDVSSPTMPCRRDLIKACLSECVQIDSL